MAIFLFMGDQENSFEDLITILHIKLGYDSPIKRLFYRITKSDIDLTQISRLIVKGIKIKVKTGVRVKTITKALQLLKGFHLS